MRLGLVTTSYPRDDRDLAGCFVAEHARYLAAQGHDLEVIAAGTPSGSGAGSISIHRVPAAPGLFDQAGAPEALATSPRAWLAAARFTAALTATCARRARHWDAAICHWLVPSALSTLIATRPRLPVLAIAHSGDVHLLRRLRAIAPLATLACRPSVRLSFVSRELRCLFLADTPAPLRRFLAARAQVCPMGIDVTRLRRARQDRAAAGPPPAATPPTVLFLGRLVPVKGTEVLARAARLWRSGARLLVAGAGPAEPALRAQAAAAPPGRIELLGHIPPAARDQLLAAADIVALPSIRVERGRSEGMPLVALEAMAAGATLVASAVGGLAELPARAVTHVPPGDPHALATAIDRLVGDPRRSAIQREAQASFIEALDWRAVGPRLVPDESRFRSA